MADFKTAKMKTLRWEGGITSPEFQKADAGGETIMGVAKNFWGDKYPGIFKRLDEIKAQANNNIKEINRIAFSDESFLAEIEKFYKDNFWDVIKGDEITDQSKAQALFDYAVNSGTSRAIKHAQEICGVTVDGKFGPATLKAINDKADFTNALCDRRTRFFEEIAKKGQNAKFLKGWLNRVKDFYV